MMMKNVGQCLTLSYAETGKIALTYTFPQFVVLLFVLGIMTFLLFDDDTGGAN